MSESGELWTHEGSVSRSNKDEGSVSRSHPQWQ